MDEDYNGVFDFNTIKNGSSFFPEEYADIFDKVNNGTSIHTGRIVTILLMVASVFGCTGNFLICYVIIYNKNMHTSINMYLFSLAVFDSIQLITFSFGAIYSNMFTRLSSYSGLKIIFVLVKSLYSSSSIASIFITLSVTVDRYIAVCYPLRQIRTSRKTRTLKNILMIWILSSAYVTIYESLPILCINYSSFSCQALTILRSLEINVIIFFLIPMVMNIILYTFIGFSIWSSSQLRCSLSNDNQNKRRKYLFRREFKMSVAVVVECLVCLAPVHIVLIISKHNLLDNVPTIRQNLMIMSFMLYLSSTFIDPIVYSIMSTKFRKAIKNVFTTSIRLWCFNTQIVEPVQSATELNSV